MNDTTQGLQFHALLLEKLGAPNKERAVKIQQILSSNYANMSPNERVRHTFGWFAKLLGAEEPFAHMCALSLALIDQPFAWPLQYRIDSKMIIKIPDAVASMLYELGRLVKAYPKLAYLNLTIDEYIEWAFRMKMFFYDSKFTQLHEFWRTIVKAIDDSMGYKIEPLIITEQLCTTIQYKVLELLKKLLFTLMTDQIGDAPPTAAAEVPYNVTKLKQESNEIFLANLPADSRDMLKGSVMLELIADNRIQNLTDHANSLLPYGSQTKLLDAQETDDKDELQPKLGEILPHDFFTNMREIVRCEQIGEADVLGFLLDSFKQSTKKLTKEDVDEMIEGKIEAEAEADEVKI